MRCTFCVLGICIDESHQVRIFDITGKTTAVLLGPDEYSRWQESESQREMKKREERFESDLRQQFRALEKREKKKERPLPYNACIGLELETNFLVICKKKQKDVVYRDSELRIDADTAVGESDGTLEFVVTKSSLKTQLVQRVQRCERIARSLIESCESISKKSSNVKRSKSKGSTGPIYSGSSLELFGEERPKELMEELKEEKTLVLDDVEVRLTEDDRNAAIQFTMGVPLACMRTYLRNAAKYSASYDGRVAIIDKIYGMIIMSGDASPTHKSSEKWRGFLLLFGLYIHDLQVWNPNEDSDEGPKNCLTVMTRTSFREMYLHLGSSKGDLEEMRRVAGEVLALVKGSLPLRDALLIAKAYPWASERGKKIKTQVTLLGWIDSIVKGTDKKFREQVMEKGISGNGEPDYLCPPDGFDELEPRYSLGAMKMDGELVIIEHRCPALLTGGVEEVDDWGTFAGLAFDFADAVLNGKDFGG
jgi:hypothetical protein